MLVVKVIVFHWPDVILTPALYIDMDQIPLTLLPTAVVEYDEVNCPDAVVCAVATPTKNFVVLDVGYTAKVTVVIPPEK